MFQVVVKYKSGIQLHSKIIQKVYYINDNLKTRIYSRGVAPSHENTNSQAERRTKSDNDNITERTRPALQWKAAHTGGCYTARKTERWLNYGKDSQKTWSMLARKTC